MSQILAMSGFFLMQSGSCPYVYSELKGRNITQVRAFMSGNHRRLRTRLFNQVGA